MYMKKNIRILVVVLFFFGFLSFGFHYSNAESSSNGSSGSTSTSVAGSTTATTSTTGGSTATTTATTTNPGSSNETVGKIINPIKVNDFSAFVATVLGIILRIAIPIVAAFIIYSGLMFVLARGNSEKLEQAKTRLLYTLLGAGILLGAWMIASVIKATIEALTA